MHSRHVVHVFPRSAKMLISEWARAIRVAHGVKKTFILAIPGLKSAKHEIGAKHEEAHVATNSRQAIVLTKTHATGSSDLHANGSGKLDFLLYHRKGADIENPRHDSPTFVMLALSEEEEIGGEELAESIAAAKHHGLDLIVGICDRETAITFYRVKRIELPGSTYEYYEIEWVQP